MTGGSSIDLANNRTLGRQLWEETLRPDEQDENQDGEGENVFQLRIPVRRAHLGHDSDNQGAQDRPAS